MRLSKCHARTAARTVVMELQGLPSRLENRNMNFMSLSQGRRVNPVPDSIRSTVLLKADSYRVTVDASHAELRQACTTATARRRCALCSGPASVTACRSRGSEQSNLRAPTLSAAGSSAARAWTARLADRKSKRGVLLSGSSKATVGWDARGLRSVGVESELEAVSGAVGRKSCV